VCQTVNNKGGARVKEENQREKQQKLPLFEHATPKSVVYLTNSGFLPFVPSFLFFKVALKCVTVQV